MENEEAIRYWESLRKTFVEYMKKAESEIGKQHYQTSIEAIDVALEAIRSTKEPEMLTEPQLRRMAGKWVKLIIPAEEGAISCWAIVTKHELNTFLIYGGDKYVSKATFDFEESGKEFYAFQQEQKNVEGKLSKPCMKCEEKCYFCMFNESKKCEKCKNYKFYTPIFNFCPYCGRKLDK